MSRRFRIALSFAGEKRDFVAQIAELLATRFDRNCILYDKYHQAEFARADLAFHLPALYNNETDLIVVVLSRDYANREWCGLEWSAIYGLIKKRKAQDVMLCRFDSVDGQGLYDLAGFVDLDRETPQQATRLILERLALNEGQPPERYIREGMNDVDWPLVPPPLEWPVADHRTAQSAFERLITRAARSRILLICGPSETGKSHLTNQFLRNGVRIPHLTCARFDFKGSTDMDSLLQAFAARLNVPAPPAGTGISSQLGNVLSSLKKVAGPTLLVFDTFELAGEAERWMNETLLLAAVSEKQRSDSTSLDAALTGLTTSPLSLTTNLDKAKTDFPALATSISTPVKVATKATITANIPTLPAGKQVSAVSLKIQLPAGITPAVLNPLNLNDASGSLSLIGGANGSLSGASFDSATNTITFGNITLTAFGSGDFLVINCTISPSATNVNAGGFSILDNQVIDTTGAAIPGITPQLSVAFQ